MPAREPLYIYKRPGFIFIVYPNRIEIQSGFGGILKGLRKDQAISMRNITDVAVLRVGGKLIISTSDGRKHEYILGTDADNAREAILDTLP